MAVEHSGTGGALPGLLAVDHVGLAVPDLDAAIAFHTEVLGLVLLHREDMYERESTRPGEADLIVAKHRNGPTRDITVAFQGHYSRFVDMAP